MSKLEICYLTGDPMSVFNKEDTHTVRSLGLTFGGFIALTVILILLAYFLTY